jgi:prophage regulatory protein
MTKILRFPTVIEKTGLSRSTIYLKISKGDFPKPVSLGANSVGFLEIEIEEWIGAKVAKRNERIYA